MNKNKTFLTRKKKAAKNTVIIGKKQIFDTNEKLITK
jgi:hypothetical protein